MEDFGERAVDFFSKGYNCSQSTAAAFAEYYKKRLCAHYFNCLIKFYSPAELQGGYASLLNIAKLKTLQIEAVIKRMQTMFSRAAFPKALLLKPIYEDQNALHSSFRP